MPTLMIPLGPTGPLLDVGVAVSTAYARHGGPPGNWRAPVDTGSNMMAISPDVVARSRPMPIGIISVGRPGGGSVACPTYDVRIKLGGRGRPGRWFELEAVEARPASPYIDVLIGMDVLRQVNMAWFGPLDLVQLSS